MLSLFLLLLLNVNALWFDHFINEEAHWPSKIEEFEMRSHLTTKKKLNCSILGYLQSIQWLRTRRTMSKVKDIYDYWRLAHSLHKLDNLMNKKVSRMLFVDCIGVFFWREHKSFFETKDNTMGMIKNVKQIATPPELTAIFSIYNPGQITRVMPFNKFRSLMQQLPSSEARKFANHTLLFWIILTNTPEPKQDLEILGRAVVLSILLQETSLNKTIRKVAANTKHKVLVLKAEMLLMTIDLWFAKTAMTYMLNLVWLMEELERSREVYELEAEIRAKMFFVQLCGLLFCVALAFPSRELLNLKTKLRERQNAIMKPYYIQRIIRLFLELQQTEAELIVRNVVFAEVIERKDKFILQDVAFDSILSYASEGQISGLIKQEENGLEPPSEFLDLFQKPLKTLMNSFLLGQAYSNLDDVLGVYFRESWQRFLTKEIAMSWRQLRSHSLFMHPSNGFFKVRYAVEESREARINSYLDAYVTFFKPIVHEFKFGQSYANLMTAFYFFHYLQYLTWIHPQAFSEDTLSRLIKEHSAFMEGSLKFAQNVTIHHRKMIGSMPFLGLWCHDGRAFDGVLVPMSQIHERGVLRHKFSMLLLRIVLYHVDFEPVGEHRALGMVRPHAMADSTLQLLVYTTKKELDAAWFLKFIERLNLDVYGQSELMLMLHPLL